ncbi:MAG: sugar ABC transporter permease [Candidatus Omnitrophota bacterium]
MLKKIDKKTLHKIVTGYSFLAPNIIGFLIFTLIPVIVCFIFAFCKWDMSSPMKFVGLRNFIELFQDGDFWYFLYNTVFFMLAIPLGMAISLIMALLLNQKLKAMVIFRTVYFLPVVSSLIAAAMVWRWIFNSDYGLLNYFLLKIGFTNVPDWLNSTFWAKPAIIIMSVWQGAGYNMLLYLAALQGIPDSLYEAASIDGAGAWEKFWYVTWPMLSFVNFFIVTMSIITGFQAFGVQYIMTQGGPLNSTMTIVYYIYRNAFEWFKMGYASAIAWFLFVLMFGLTYFNFRMRKNEGYSLL